MAKPVLVVFADAHMSARTWKHKHIFGDTYFGLKQVVDFAIDNELPLFGAGDLIDKRENAPAPIVEFEKQLRRMSEAELTFFYIQGQHEYDQHPWLQLGLSTIHMHEHVINLDGLEVYGLDYQGGEVLQAKLDDIPKSVDVLVAHQVWSDFMGDVALPQGEFADIPHVRTLVTGDYHKCVLDDHHYRGKNGQKLLVFSPGATCQQKIDEPDKHHFGVLNDDGSIDIINLRSRKFDEHAVNNNDQVEELLGNVDAFLEGAADFASDNDLPPELHTPIWRIIYSHRVSDVVRRLDKIVDGRAHLFYKEIPQEKEESKILEKVPDLKKGDVLTLESCLSTEVDPDEEPDAHALAARLLDADDPELEVNRWLKEQMND